MRDACEVGVLTAVTTGPEPTDTWVYGDTVRCRFIRRSTRELVDGDLRDMTDVRIHVPSGTAVENSTRFKVIKRNGKSLATVEYFDVKGEPWETEDNRVIVCDCQTVGEGIA